MAETTLTHEQLQALLEKAIGAAVTAARAMNPLEQKKYDEELRKEKRRTLLTIELGRAEAQSRWNKQQGCSHCRYPATAGQRGGEPAPRGQGEWCTSGQVHGFDTISIICTRCQTLWKFKATPQEIEYANQAGLIGFAPPQLERCINKEDFVSKPVEPNPAKLEQLAV